MGYHVIFSLKRGDFDYEYAETLQDLARLPLDDDCIVYEAPENAEPFRIGSHKTLAKYRFKGHRLGVLGEELFQMQAEQEGYILEKLSQDRESFKSYTNNTYVPIKRGDFLVRNCYNFEIEVKCRAIFQPKLNQDWVFEFRKDHLEKHLNMSEFTKTPIIIAIYDHNGRQPLPNSLIMMEVRYMDKLIHDLRLPTFKRSDENGKYEVYQIPAIKAMPGFELIEYLRRKYFD